MGFNGIDVSNNNGPVNLVTLKPGFVIAKATEGTDFSDPSYGRFADQATEILKVPFGAYHFFHAEALNARAQADHFGTVARVRSMLSLWLDYETFGASGESDAEQIGFFIDEVKVNFPLAKVGIYTNGTGLARIRPFMKEIPYNGLWYASLNGDVAPQTDPEYQINQFAIKDGIDQDFITWTESKWRAYWTWAK
jgi:GH25 family lysozyme M1 (1,4-beta-N-acetylmuramidase)